MKFLTTPLFSLLFLSGWKYVASFGVVNDKNRNSITTSASSSSSSSSSRRQILQSIVGSSLLANNILPIQPAQAEEEELIQVYFGCGCFWHVMHEFVMAEKNILNRADLDITSRAGYAGGLVPSEKVCYHNALNIGDYGKLGHAEVVSMSIPPSKLKDFAREYFLLFDAKGNRPDQNGDRGPEYRNLVGIPGGSKSPLAQELIEASKLTGDKLDFAIGKGNDKDLRAVSFIMDSDKFPFLVAEQYHQFHDGFNLNENYPNSYNSLASKLAKEGKLEQSACPNGLIGVGVLGL